MKALFRLDADGTIGLGHLMRSLVLADALRERGIECAFACRPDGPWLARRVEDAGHDFHEIGAADRPPSPRDDAELSAALARRLSGGRQRLALLVVDHYRLDACWESIVGQHAERVLVIDDLADREHRCDLLLDTCPGRNESDYAALVPGACDVMAGEHFALIREEIAAARTASLARRRAAGFAVRRVLITMGGADVANDSTAVLALLDDVLPSADIAVDVVLGAACPWVKSVRETSASMARAVRVLVDIDDMGAVMAGSDLAIGASGGTSLERCVLGLPSIALVTADNQRHTMRALSERGAVLPAMSHRDVRRLLVEQFTGWPTNADAVSRLADVGEAAAALCDGRGRQRVLARLLA